MSFETEGKFESYLSFGFERWGKLENRYSGARKGVVLGMECWLDEDWRVGYLRHVLSLKSEEENGVVAFHCLEWCHRYSELTNFVFRGAQSSIQQFVASIVQLTNFIQRQVVEL